ncbi:hypothetical protein [Acanthopleuribacter pedis]|uniref:Uncharacterized protein n=1 Tax=Acanthopleuribacter pedis TaxID=442870 RepID=A0A8J7U631_9BACT|nr:hypothetical protein [Acanthopleuribacter pedis]MBO1321464.1 hypothetical protein [Acanthopleuribacter pedis]
MFVSPVPGEEKEKSWIIEPKEGHSDEEVMTQLRRYGVSDINHLSTGFIKAIGKTPNIQNIRNIAFFQEKVGHKFPS